MFRVKQKIGLPCGSAGKEFAHNVGDLGSILGLGRSPGEGKGCPLQCSGLERAQFSCSVQLLSRVRLFVTPWTVAHKAFLSITNSWSLLKLMSIESVMPSNHLILCGWSRGSEKVNDTQAGEREEQRISYC